MLFANHSASKLKLFGGLLNPSHEKQNDKDDQDDADESDATVTIPVPIAAEAATESTEQEDYENDNEDETERHGGVPFFSAMWEVKTANTGGNVAYARFSLQSQRANSTSAPAEAFSFCRAPCVKACVYRKRHPY